MLVCCENVTLQEQTKELQKRMAQKQDTVYYGEVKKKLHNAHITFDCIIT
jgi:hypothetical protein